MPKQIYNIQQFHGGLSSNSDPRDVDDSELTSATDVMVDEIGKIRMMGGNTAHDAGSSTAIGIEPGYGLFKWSHDSLYAHLGEHFYSGYNFVDGAIAMSDMLSSAQKTALADSLDSDNDTFDFATSTTTLVDGDGFTATNATFVNASAVGQLTNTASAQGIVTIPFTTVANRTYQVEFDVTAINTAQINVSLGTSAAYNSSNAVTSSGAATGLTLAVAYTANDTSSFLALRLSTSTSGHWVKIDNLKIITMAWDPTGDMTVDSTDATYTHSSGAGTLIQTAANRLETGIANKEYIFTYTISSWTNANITAFRIKGTGSEFAAAHTNLDQSNGTHSVVFTSHATDPAQPFTIDVTSDGAASFNIEYVSLRLYDVAETGDDYLVLADDESSDPAIYIYSKNEDDWSDSQVLTLGSTSNPKTSFYSVDGALRISDGNFGANNANRWYGYIDRTLWEGLSPSFEIKQWYDTFQKVDKPSTCFYNGDISHSGSGTYGTAITTAGSISAQNLNQTSFTSQDEITKVELNTKIYAPTTSDPVNFVVRVGPADDGSFLGPYQDVTVVNDFLTPGWYEFKDTLYFALSDTTVGSFPGATGTESFRAEIETSIPAGTMLSGLMSMKTYEDGAPPTDLSANLFNNNAFLEIDWEVDSGASGWRGAVAGSGKWETGFSFIYDEIQESQISVSEDVSTGATTLTVPAPDDATTAPNIRLFFADWDNVDDPWNKRITGCNMYMRDVAQSTTQSWFLQISVDFIEGKALVASSQKEFDAVYYAQANQPYYYFEIGSNIGGSDASEMLEPSLVTTYEVKSGLDAIEKSVISQFRSAVVIGRRVYAGGLMVQNEDESKDIMADAMIKTPVNKFDMFPLSRIIEASVRDGDEIIKLEEYADRILQFKKNKMHIINVSQEIEFLEDTFTHKGISHPAAAVKTDFGVAWVNRLGCYLYDGQKVHNLLEKGGRQIIKESDWTNFTSDNSMIGYLPKKRQLVVARDSRGTFTLTGSINPTGTNVNVPGSGTKFLTELSIGDSILVSGETRIIDSITNDTTATVSVAWGSDLANDTTPECLPTGNVFIYDMVTQSWVKGDSSLTDGVLKTNFVTDWNGDLVHAHTNGTVLKWDDLSAASTTFEMITKDIDLGQPGQRKKLHRVYVTYKSGSTTNVQVDYDVNGGTTFPYDFADGTNFASTELASASGWQVAELKPDTSSEANNIKSFRLRFATDGIVPLGFEINDISAVYRLKHIK